MYSLFRNLNKIKLNIKMTHSILNWNITTEVRNTNISAKNVHIFHLITARSYLLHPQDIRGQVKNNPCTLLLNFFFIRNKNLFKWLLWILVLLWASLYSKLENGRKERYLQNYSNWNNSWIIRIIEYSSLEWDPERSSLPTFHGKESLDKII